MAGRPSDTAVAAAFPGELLRAPEEVASPVLQIVLERARSGSRPRAREDDRLVCLAVEGGGMRGAVAAGMCVALEAAGLAAAFDRVYGVSAGAGAGCAIAAGQAALSATYYEDAATRRVINKLRPLLGRPVVDYDLLFDDIIAAHKPLSLAGLATGPEFRALATSLETRSLRVLQDFADGDELMQAVRASAAIPRLGGAAATFRGERMADGGLIEPIPYPTALREGATDVLVLRSRGAGYRQPALRDLGEYLALRDDAEIVELLRRHHGVYNQQAAELERGGERCRVSQVCVPDGTRLIGRLETRAARVSAALRAGAMAMAATIFTGSIDLCWQPVVYRRAG